MSFWMRSESAPGSLCRLSCTLACKVFPHEDCHPSSSIIRLRRHTEIHGSSSLRLDGIIPLTMKGISDASPSRVHASADICLFSLPASCLPDATSLSSYSRGCLWRLGSCDSQTMRFTMKEGTQKHRPPDEAKKHGKEKQMGVFRHKDPWQHHRAELIERGKAGTALLTAEQEAVVRILLSVSPETKFTYQPYLIFLSSEGWATERAKFPEQFLAACSLRLLVLSVTSQGILPEMWRFSLATPVFEELSAHGLSLLRRLLALLGKQPDYSIISTLALGSLQAALITTVRRHYSRPIADQ